MLCLFTILLAGDNLPYTVHPLLNCIRDVNTPAVALLKSSIQRFESTKGPSADSLSPFALEPLFWPQPRGRWPGTAALPLLPRYFHFFLFSFAFHCLPVLFRFLIAELPLNEVAKWLLGFALVESYELQRTRYAGKKKKGGVSSIGTFQNQRECKMNVNGY